MGIVTFRCAPDGWADDRVDALTRRLASAINEEGDIFLTKTTLDDRPVLRLCPINPRTTADDIRKTMDRLDALRRTIPESL
jgi:glutamate/tyrosine decarboxylase-like PLP-dependent enzyme